MREKWNRLIEVKWESKWTENVNDYIFGWKAEKKQNWIHIFDK